MKAAAYTLLLVLEALSCICATTQPRGFETDQQCESDHAVHVQKDLKAFKTLEHAVLTTTCDIADINLGICSGITNFQRICTDCSPNGEELIPTDADGFAALVLNCGQDSCTFATDPPSENDFYKFKDSTNYLACATRACSPFNVRNAGAICCENSQSCQRSFFELASFCGGDVCCNGRQTCQDSSFEFVRSMACFGSLACHRSSVNLSQNLVVGGRTAQQPASEASFSWRGSEGNCIRITGGNQSLGRSNLTFEAGNVRMLCNKGTEACKEVKVVLSSGSCFHVTCGSSDQHCNNFEVLPAASESTFQCFCTGDNCGWTAQFSYCQNTTQTNPHPCGDAICPGMPPMCVRDETATHPVTCNLLGSVPMCNATNSTTSTTTASSTPGGSVEGDPHLRTLDGRHYTLMQQGNFLLWGFAGETRVSVQAAEGTRKVPVDFEIFTHYAGRASFTKSLLLVDKSGSQALEVTAKDCLWHHQRGVSTWQPVESAFLNLSDSAAVNLSTSRSEQKKLELFINEGSRLRTLAKLWVSCRPGHQLAAKIQMSLAKDLRFVRGELAPGRLSLSTGWEHHQVTQRSTDQEFAVTSDWAELGGSPAAASYLKAVDATGHAISLRACSQGEQEEYTETCKKYLGDSRDLWYQQVMDDCIFDLCSGAGETSAQLAAEIFHAN